MLQGRMVLYSAVLRAIVPSGSTVLILSIFTKKVGHRQHNQATRLHVQGYSSTECLSQHQLSLKASASILQYGKK